MALQTMNVNYYKEWLTDKELIRAYESDPDPVIRRLIRIILDIGFDVKIPSDSYATTIVEYIDELKQDIRHLEEELDICQKDLSEATAKADKLSTRTVPQLLADLAAIVKDEQRKNQDLRKEISEALKREEEATHKLNMWSILND